MRTIEFRGVKVAYNELCVKNWRWQKAVVSEDVKRSTKAIERLLDNEDEYYVYALGTDDPISMEAWHALGPDEQDDLLDLAGDGTEAMGELVNAIMQDMGAAAKN